MENIFNSRLSESGLKSGKTEDNKKALENRSPKLYSLPNTKRYRISAYNYIE